MVTLNQLMDAVAAEVTAQYPGEPIFTDQLPKDFKRPSFALECQKNETAGLNPFLVQRTVALLLTCFVELNAYHDSSREALNGRMDALCAHFAQGYLRVGDRAVRLQTDRGTSAPDFAGVTLLFSWVDGRSGYQDPNAPDSGIPKMRDFAVNGAVLAGGAPEKGDGE